MMPTRSDHLILTAILQDESVRIMLDSGANRSYTSLRIGNKLAQQKHKKDKPYPLIIADGKPINHDDGWIRNELRDIQLTIGQYTEWISLDIVNIKYDIILGMSWLKTHNPIVN